MNPIENCWGLIVNACEQGQERTRDQVVQHVMQEWEALRRNQATIYNLVSSMPKRLQEVIDAEGGWSSY